MTLRVLFPIGFAHQKLLLAPSCAHARKHKSEPTALYKRVLFHKRLPVNRFFPRTTVRNMHTRMVRWSKNTVCICHPCNTYFFLFDQALDQKEFPNNQTHGGCKYSAERVEMDQRGGWLSVFQLPIVRNVYSTFLARWETSSSVVLLLTITKTKTSKARFSWIKQFRFACLRALYATTRTGMKVDDTT